VSAELERRGELGRVGGAIAIADGGVGDGKDRALIACNQCRKRAGVSPLGLAYQMLDGVIQRRSKLN